MKIKVCPSSVIDADFEDSTTGSWVDESADGAFKWKVMGGFLAPDEINFQVPNSTISAGIRYLQLIRMKPNSFGVAKLTSSPFTASPGDTIQFDFSISSKFPRFNNLQVI